MGELELDCGSKALEEKRYEDAMEHFLMGSKLSSAGSMFNLALCYELGIGTSIDYVKVSLLKICIMESIIFLEHPFIICHLL